MEIKEFREFKEDVVCALLNFPNFPNGRSLSNFLNDCALSAPL